MKLFQNRYFPILCILISAVGWKLVFLLRDLIPFNADEAVVALMAKHILQGERPIFFYGQAYMGSLDAWLVAGGFVLFGQQVWVIRLVQILLYLGVLLTTIRLGMVIFGSGRIGLLAAVLLAFPAVNTTLYTTASLGGYGEALLIGNLILLAGFACGQQITTEGRDQKPWLWLAWGDLAGLGLWANGLTLVYSVPSGLYLLWSLFRNPIWQNGRKALGFLVLAGVGILIGAFPWWLYAIQNGPATLASELLGTAVAVEREPWLRQVISHLLNYVALGLTALFGFRPPWTVRWLAMPLMPFILAFWIGVVGWLIHKLSRPGPGRAEQWTLAGVLLVVTAGFLFTPFGIDPSGRYFLPMVIPLALFAGSLMIRVSSRLVGQTALAGLMVLFNIWGTIQASALIPGLTTQFYEPSIIDHRYDGKLIAFLEQQGETRGYSNYWVAYPLAFLSQENLIFIPALAYHPDMRYTSRDDRYLPYRIEVERSQKVAYIVTNNPPLEQALRTGLDQQGVSWLEQQIGDYQVFYRLSKTIRPDKLNLSLLQGGQN